MGIRPGSSNLRDCIFPSVEWGTLGAQLSLDTAEALRSLTLKSPICTNEVGQEDL